MDKREFLKASGAFVAANLISGALAEPNPEQHAQPRTNWAGNYTYRTDNLLTPGSVDEVRKVVKSCAKLRALGTRHSFNAIADSTADQISLKRLDQISIDEKARTVTRGRGNSLWRSGYGDRQARLRGAQPGLAAAHLGGRRVRHRHPRLRCPQRQPRHASRGARNRYCRWRDGPPVPREGRRPFPRRGGRTGLGGRGHQRDPRRAADIPSGAVGLPESFLRSPAASLRRDLLQRLQRQPVYRLAESSAPRRFGSSAASRPATPTNGRRSSSAPSSPAKSCIRSPGTPRKPAPNSRAFPARGTSACPTSV